MAFWNKDKNITLQHHIEDFIFDRTCEANTGGFLKRLIRDALSLEYDNLDESIKECLFYNFRYYNNIIIPFQSLLINILGKKGNFSIVNYNNVKQYVPYKKSEIQSLSYDIIGYSESYKGSNKESIEYNLEYFPLKQYEYIFHMQKQIFKNMQGAVNLSNKPILKIENGNETIENVEAFKIKASQVINNLYIDKSSMIYMGNKDSIDITMVDFDNYIKAFNVLDNELARLSGFPLTYIRGLSSTGFNSTKEGERVQEEKALMNFSKHIVVPLLQEIQNRCGSAKTITIKPPVGIKMFEVKILSQMLSAIDKCDSITLEEKEKLKKQYLNI